MDSRLILISISIICVLFNEQSQCDALPFSCRGRCGEPQSFGFCGCDSSCARYGLCCYDYLRHCQQCPNPGEISGGSFRPVHDAYANGASVTYSCDRGFVLSSVSRVRRCVGGEWNRSQPLCRTPFFRFCRAPNVTDPLSYVPSDQTTFWVGSYVVFSCRLEYELIGPERALCGNTHRWSLFPTCSPRCQRPRAPANGNIQASGLYFNNEEEITYNCRCGYELINGPATVVCDYGSWSHAPSCQQLTCPHRLPPEHGSYSPAETTTWYARQTVTFSCGDYYTLEGSETSRCRCDGSWSSPVPTCEYIKPLREPVVMSYSCVGQCTDEEVPDVPCQCYAGCDPTLSNCCPNNDVCQPSDDQICPTLSSVEYGSVSISGYIATYSCDDGYYLVGNEERICEYGSWSGSIPHCFSSRASCKDRCNEPLRGDYICACDQYCLTYLNCCPDYVDHC